MFDNIIKILFPSRCVLCDSVLPYGNKIHNEYLCDDCKKHFEFIIEPTCKKCGAMIYDEDDLICERCKNSFKEHFEYGFGLCRYNDYVKESIHRIKYKGRKEYLNFYGKCMAKMFINKIKKINPDCIVPVPIHKNRLRERGYNQASVLSNALSKELYKLGVEVPVNNNLIFRNKNTKVLNKLDKASRVSELENAFYINKDFSIEKVLLIDDIYTTGATIDKISEQLKLNGIKEVYFAVISVVDNL